jgi:hypothetical protein
VSGWQSLYCGTYDWTPDARCPGVVRSSTASLAMWYARLMSLLRRNSAKKDREKIRAAPSLTFVFQQMTKGTRCVRATCQCEATPALKA